MTTILQFGKNPGRSGPRSRPLAAGSGAWKLLLFVGALLASFGAKAQVSGYSVAQTTGTYTAITVGGGATNIASSTTSDDATYTSKAIGFTFNYNGTNFTTVSISDNGNVRMGASANTSYTPLSSNGNTIAAMGQDQNGNGSGALLVQTIGIAPNRTYVIQWQNYQRYNELDTYNYQVRLNETTNTINIVYGAFTVSTNTSRTTTQVGLTGTATSDFNDRTGSFPATTAGSANSATVTINSTAVPTNGQTLTFTPPACAAPAPTASSVTTNSASVAFTTVSGDTYTITTTPASTPATQTVSASPVTVSGLNPGTTYTVNLVRNCAGGAISPAATTTFTTVSAQPAAAYGFTQSTGTYTPITTAGGATTISATGSDDENVYSATVPFSFPYNSGNFTALSVSSNGWVALGTASGTNYTPLTSLPNVIAPFGRDLNGNGSGAVQTQVIGSAPNRTFVIQWSNYQPFAAGNTSLNFQVRLSETTGAVNIVYGSCLTTNTTVYTPQVGITGTTVSDFNDRTSTSSGTGINTDAWLTTNGGTTNSATVNYSSTAYPGSGLTFTYTPPSPTTCQPVQQVRASGITAVAASVAFTLPAIAATNYTVTLAPGGATQTVTASPVALTGLTAGTVYTATFVSNCGGPTSVPTVVAFRTDNNCSPVTGVTVSSITTTGAQVAFSPPSGGGVTNYTVTVSPAAATPAQTTQTVAASPATLTGLMAGATYTVSVVGNCSAGGTSAAATASFTTTFTCANPTYAAVTLSTPVFESFEGTWLNNCATHDVPTLNWKNSPATGNNSWRRDDDGASGGWTSPSSGYAAPTGSQSTTHSARFHSYYTSLSGSLDYYLDLSAAGYKVLTFDFRKPVAGDILKVQLSTNGGTTFTDLATYNTAVSAFTTKTIALGATSGGSATSVVRFLATGTFSFSSDLGLDNVVVSANNCPPPTLAATTNIAYNQATVNFTSNGGGTFYVSYGPAGFTPGSGVNEIVSGSLPAGTTAYTITGLTASTPYDFYVSQDCSNTSNGGGVSNYSALGTFTTGVACPTPTGISATGVNYQGATINYTAAVGGGSFVIRYAPTGTAGFTSTTGGTVVTGPIASTSKVLSGLTASTGYTYYVSQDCTGSSTGQGTSTPSAAFTFTTTVGCPAPTAGTTTNVTNNTATVNFTAAAGGGTYTIRYAPTGTAGFTATTGGTVVTAPAGATSANLTGLTAATGYTFYVMQDCTGSATGTGVSAASSAATFSTNVNPPAFTTSRSTVSTMPPAPPYISIVGGMGTTAVPFAGTSTDDQLSNAITLPAGFAFTYLGTAVTGFKVCTNGWMTVNTAETSNSYTNALGASPPTAVLAPFWEDLVTQGNPSTTASLNASMVYQVSGTAPNRVLTVEWIAMEKFAYAGPSLNFQVVLTETTNTIEYRYGNMTGFDGTAGTNFSAPLTFSIGLNGYTNISSGNYLALQAPNTNYFLNANAGTANAGANALSVTPACYSSRLFVPGTYATGPAPVVGAPSNDDPAGAIGLALAATAPTSDNGGFCSTYSSANATPTSGIQVCSATTPGTADDDVFFTFTTLAGGPSNITVYAAGAAGYDPVLQILSGTPGSLTSLACVNATGGGLIETSSLTALPANTTYYVRVYDANTGSGANGAFALAAYATPTPPANDECVAAVTLSATTTTCTPTAGTTIGATASASVPTCTAGTPGTNDDDVWYKFTAVTAGDYTITVQSGSGFNAVLQTFTGACGALAATNCVNNTGNGGIETVNILGAAAGTTYYALVYHSGIGSGSGNFTICAKKACDAPTGVSSNSVLSTSANITFTASLGNTSYTVTATPSSGPVVTNTGATSPIALSGLTTATTYSVVVRGNCNAQAASAAYSFTTLGPPPANDECMGALLLSVNVTCNATNTNAANATQSQAPILCAGFTASQANDVWFKFVASTTDLIVTASGFDGVMEGFSGTCGALTSLSCADDFGTSDVMTLSGLTIGNTYYVRYYPYSASPPNTAFTICVNPPSLTATTTGVSASGGYGNIIVQNGAVLTLSGTTNILGTVQVQSGGTLNTACQLLNGNGSFTLQAGATLGICSPQGLSNMPNTGAVQTTGTRSFSTDASYTYNGTVAQVTGDGLPATVRNLTVNNSLGLTLTNALRVAQLVRLQSGDLATGTANNLTLLSTPGFSAGLSAGRTALIDNTGGAVTGAANVMQRAIDNVYTGDNIGYHHFSSPMVFTTLNDLGDTPGFVPQFDPGSFNTTAAVGYVRPFPTVLGYNETRVGSPQYAIDQTAFNQGYFAPLGTDTWTPGKAYAVNSPNAVTLDFTGQFNNSPVAAPVAFAGLQGLTRGTNADAGWQLLGNPFPAPLDFTTVNFATQATNLDPSIYQYHSTSRYGGYFTTYQGNAMLGTQPTVPAGGGFFMRVTAPGTPGSLSLTNANRVTSYAAGAQASFGRSATTRPTLQLQLDGANLTDKTYLYFEAQATGNMDPAYDAAKLTNPNGMNLATMAGATPLAIDGRPTPTAATVVALFVTVPAAGNYTLTATDLTSFGSTQAWLRDALTGTRTLLSAGTAYRFTAGTASLNGRFALEFAPAGAALATAAQALAAQVQLYPNPTKGRFHVTLPSGTKAATAVATDVLGQVVFTRTLTTSEAEFELPTTGVYTLRLTIDGNTVTRKVVVE